MSIVAGVSHLARRYSAALRRSEIKTAIKLRDPNSTI